MSSELLGGSLGLSVQFECDHFMAPAAVGNERELGFFGARRTYGAGHEKTY